MNKEAVIFHDYKDLMELTGLTDHELWREGFELDDFDGGIRVKEPLDNSTASAVV